MKLLAILNCARPVLFANDSGEYPYSLGGTAFIVKFQGRNFVITAKHVLNLKSFEAGQLCIQYRPDGRDFLPLGALHLVRGANEDDTDQYDIAVREIDDGAAREELYCEYQPYSLKQMDRLTILSERGSYLYRGYPIAMRKVDFENRHIEQGAVTTRAEYVGGGHQGDGLGMSGIVASDSQINPYLDIDVKAVSTIDTCVAFLVITLYGMSASDNTDAPIGGFRAPESRVTISGRIRKS